MTEVKARVVLLSYTPNPLSVIYAAYRQCYFAGEISDMWQDLLSEKISSDQQASFIKKIIASGHVSPIEHVSFTFAVSGVSRALTHQLVRHRIASYSQQSQRYVDASNIAHIIPPSIKANPEALSRFESFMDEVTKAYADLKDILEKKSPGKAPLEDVRFVLPQAAATNIVITMNCRSLLHFFEERCCNRAQWEIRSMAHQMLTLCKTVLPAIFENAGAKCERLKYCPEGKKFTCGKYPTEH